MNSAVKKTLAVAGGAAVLLVVVWYFALFSPQSSKLKAAHKNYNAAEGQVAGLNQQVVQLDALQAQIPSDTKKLQALKQAIPDDPDLADALGQLHQVATNTGVTLSDLGPSLSNTQASSSATPTIGLSMSVTGSYGGLMNFLTALENMPRTTVVNSVSLNSTAGAMSASVQAEIFYANSSSNNNGSAGTTTGK